MRPSSIPRRPVDAGVDTGEEIGNRSLRPGVWPSEKALTAREELLMARAGTKILDSGEPLPALTMVSVAHGQVTLPDAFGDGWGVLLLYRAHW